MGEKYKLINAKVRYTTRMAQNMHFQYGRDEDKENKETPKTILKKNGRVSGCSASKQVSLSYMHFI